MANLLNQKFATLLMAATLAAGAPAEQWSVRSFPDCLFQRMDSFHSGGVPLRSVLPEASVRAKKARPASTLAAPTGIRQFKNSALGISFWAPSSYTILGDPADLKKVMTRAGQAVNIPPTLAKQVLEGLQFMCVHVRAGGETGTNDILLLAVERLPTNNVSTQEYLAANMQSTAASFPGTKMVGAPTPRKIGGLDFLGQQYLRADPDGGKRFCKFLVAVEGTRGYIVQIAAPDAAGLTELEGLFPNLNFKDRS